MAIFLAYSTSGITSGKKNCREFKMAAILNFFKYKPSFKLTSEMKTSSQIMPKKTTFFYITKNLANISPLNFLCIGIMRLWRQLYKYIFMTSLTTSPSHKISQIFKYFSYSVDQRLKMSEMLMAIYLAYSTSGIASGKKNCREFKMAAILKIFE